MRLPGFAVPPYTVMVLVLYVVTSLIAASVYLGIAVLFPFIQDEFGASRAQLGLIASGIWSGFIAASLFMGWLTDAMNVRRLQTVSLLVMGLGVLVFSQSQTIVHAILLGFLVGISISALMPAGTKAVIDWVSPRYRGLSIGAREMSIPIGGIIAASLLPFLAVAFGWRNSMIFMAITVAVTSVVFFVLYRDKPTTDTGQAQKRSTKSRIALVVKNRDIWLAGLFAAAFSGSIVAYNSYLVLFLKEDLGKSVVTAGLMLAITQVGSACGRLMWGLVSDFLLGSRRVIVLAMSGVLACITLSLMTWLPSNAPLGLIMGLVFLVGLTAFGWTAVWVTFTAELAGPDLTGTTLGFSSTIIGVATMLVPPLFGLVVDRTGSYDMGWWMLVGIAGIGTMLLAFLRPQPQRHAV